MKEYIWRRELHGLSYLVLHPKALEPGSMVQRDSKAEMFTVPIAWTTGVLKTNRASNVAVRGSRVKVSSR